MNKRTPGSAPNGKHVRRDTRLTRAAVILEQILKQGGSVAQRIKAEWPAWELWRLRRGYRRLGLEGAVTMKRLTRGRIALEHWSQVVEDAPVAADGSKG